ncbi:AIM24 family protein [bacterium]|nr:AIM24 family protein [bacterium]
MKKKSILLNLLKELLNEILKDGKIDANENQSIRSFLKNSNITREEFQIVYAQVKQEVEIKQSDESINFIVFFRRAQLSLSSHYSNLETSNILESLISIFQLEKDFLVKNGPKIFIQESKIQTQSSKKKEKTMENKTETFGKFKIVNQEGISYVEVDMDNDQVTTESGAMRYFQGNITMEVPKTSVSGFFKAALTSETVFKPKYTGSGTLVLEPSLGNFFAIELDNEEYILDKGAFWACDSSITVGAFRNSSINSLFGGEGWFQTSVKGTGTVIVCTPGPFKIINLENSQLVVDGSFAIARQARLEYSVTKSTKSIFGSLASGEGMVNSIKGTGKVFLAPIPNHSLMIQDIIQSSLGQASSK